MPIKSIKINNFKSLKKIKINFENEKYELCCIMGKNGTGKSSILDSLKYFYDNLNSYNIDRKVIDTSNPYIEKMEIDIIYDLTTLLKKNKNNFIKKELEEIKEYLNLNNEIHVKLTQYKDNSIKFYPDKRKLLKFLHRNFPVYFIDTRFITLENWDIIWEIVSDISKTNLKIDETALTDNLDNTYSSIYGDKYSKTVQIMEKIFKNESISTNKYNYNMRYKNILMSRLGGNEFIKEGNQLNYYSDGLNSLNFMKLIMRLISELSTTGLKEPILIIDEIEIGLHPQYVNLMADIIEENVRKNMNTIISTHSPSLVSSLIKSNLKVQMLRVGTHRNLTIIEIMKEIVEEKNKPIFTINESYCYFSNMIVFVEGASEMQLFMHKRIKGFFNILNKIDIYSYNSNNTKLKFIYPNNTNFKIPHLLIVDMDKILKKAKDKTTNSSKFILNNDYLVNPLSNSEVKKQEKLLYYSKRDYKKFFTYNLRQYIVKFIDKYRFNLDKDIYSIKDKSFERLMLLIKAYCTQYNIFPVKTTIEGILINSNNWDKVVNWLEVTNQCKIETLREVLENDIITVKRLDIKYRTTVLRLIFNGKFDDLKEMKENIFSSSIQKKINTLKKQTGGKADGWITQFIDYYFENYIDIIDDYDKKREQFKSDFLELDSIIQIIKNMIKYDR